ncbi:MAG: hypothetical protein CL608_01865 [Anaerolineaceae bacterium]|nr:hypothetical protein [Anaerolineaceae bacterium]
MVQRCEHCGQTVMTTDKQCWHCGKKLSSGKSTLAKPPQLATAVSEENSTPMPPFTTILLYAGLTAVALLILMATTRAIGQAPLFVTNSDNVPPAGWQPFTDNQLRFTLNLPETWQLFDMTRAPETLTLRSSPPLQAIDQTFDALVPDTQLLFLGTEDTAVFDDGSPVFVLVAQSRRLQQLSPEQIIAYAQAQLPENVTLSAVNQLKDSVAEQTGSLLFNIEQDETLWRCLEQIGPGDDSVYLVVTCTSFAQYPRHQSDFEAILRSFQPLGS